jgi:hypothetical protein
MLPRPPSLLYALSSRFLTSSLLACRGWEQVNLTGDYVWAEADEVAENHDGYVAAQSLARRTDVCVHLV